ncbi:hypothetical protein LCGC14_2493450, partial [marine sediment metagenome]
LGLDLEEFDERLEFAERRVRAIRQINFIEDFLSGGKDLTAEGWYVSSHLDWKLVSSPADPSTGFIRIFADTDNSNHLTQLDSSNNEIDLAYLDADAIAAVEGEGTLDLTGEVTIASTKSLTLKTDGSSGGVKFGSSGDVILYRGASNKLYLGTGDSLRLVSGTLEVDTIAEVASGGGVTIDGQLIKDGSVVVSRIGASTFSTLQDLQNVFHSAGWISGGVISDAGGANVNIAAGTGLIRTSDSQTAELQFFDWAASTGNAIPSDTIRYIGVEYNAGSPQVVVRTTENWNATTDFELGIVINEGGTLHIFQHRFEVGDHASSMIERLHGVAYVARDNFVGGIILGESGTNKVTLTAGTLWSGLTEYPISALDTNVAGSFDRYYRNSPSGFVKEAAQTDWPNTQYDDGSGSLVVMTNNRYAVLWFYVETDDEVIMLYGRNQYVTAALAENEAVPATVPDRLAAHGLLIGKLIFQKSAASATEISSVFTATFTHLGVTSHADLA